MDTHRLHSKTPDSRLNGEPTKDLSAISLAMSVMTKPGFGTRDRSGSHDPAGLVRLPFQLYLNAGIPLSWSFVALMTAWSGYHFSLADRADVVPVVGVVVEGGAVVARPAREKPRRSGAQ
jgi:hypothetical protein